MTKKNPYVGQFDNHRHAVLFCIGIVEVFVLLGKQKDDIPSAMEAW